MPDSNPSRLKGTRSGLIKGRIRTLGVPEPSIIVPPFSDALAAAAMSAQAMKASVERRLNEPPADPEYRRYWEELQPYKEEILRSSHFDGLFNSSLHAWWLLYVRNVVPSEVHNYLR